MMPVFETRVDYVDFEINLASVSLLFGGNVIYSINEFVTSNEDVERLEKQLIKKFSETVRELLLKPKLEHIK